MLRNVVPPFVAIAPALADTLRKKNKQASLFTEQRRCDCRSSTTTTEQRRFILTSWAIIFFCQIRREMGSDTRYQLADELLLFNASWFVYIPFGRCGLVLTVSSAECGLHASHRVFS